MLFPVNSDDAKGDPRGMYSSHFSNRVHMASLLLKQSHRSHSPRHRAISLFRPLQPLRPHGASDAFGGSRTDPVLGAKGLMFNSCTKATPVMHARDDPAACDILICAAALRARSASQAAWHQGRLVQGISWLDCASAMSAGKGPLAPVPLALTIPPRSSAPPEGPPSDPLSQTSTCG